LNLWDSFKKIYSIIKVLETGVPSGLTAFQPELVAPDLDKAVSEPY
jgi:hypothetical protein